MNEVKANEQGDSPSLALLFKWGKEIKPRGLQQEDVNDLIRNTFLVAHVSKPGLIARPKSIPSIESKHSPQLKLPFEIFKIKEAEISKEVIVPTPGLIHHLRRIHDSGQFFRLVQGWIESKTTDLCFFTLSDIALQEMRRELVTGNKPSTRPQEMRFLFKVPQLRGGEHLILLMDKPTKEFIVVHIDDDKLYRNCLSLWHAGLFTSIKTYVINSSTWYHFVALYDRRVEEGLYQSPAA